MGASGDLYDAGAQLGLQFFVCTCSLTAQIGVDLYYAPGALAPRLGLQFHSLVAYAALRRRSMLVAQQRTPLQPDVVRTMVCAKPWGFISSAICRRHPSKAGQLQARSLIQYSPTNSFMQMTSSSAM